MKDKVLRTNDAWKAYTEEKQIAFCKYIKEKPKILNKLAKYLDSNIPTFCDAIRQHLRNFCNDAKAEQKPKNAEKSEEKKEEEGVKSSTETNRKGRERTKERDEK